MSKKTGVCYGCDRRVVGCHSACGDYLAEREALNAKNRKIREIKAQDGMVRDYRIKTIKKVQHKKEKVV
jgi:hypothetical protein